jgi:hypothetical protein
MRSLEHRIVLAVQAADLRLLRLGAVHGGFRSWATRCAKSLIAKVRLLADGEQVVDVPP